MRLSKLTDLSPRQQEISDRDNEPGGAARGVRSWSGCAAPNCARRLRPSAPTAASIPPLTRGCGKLSPPIAARHWDAQYSWNAHVGKAADLGVSRESLTALAEHREPHFTSKDEDIVYRFSSEILGDHFVSDATFAEALAELGDQGIVDLIGSLGNFSMLAMLLNACQVDLQAVEPPFPDVRGYAKVPENG